MAFVLTLPNLREMALKTFEKEDRKMNKLSPFMASTLFKCQLQTLENSRKNQLISVQLPSTLLTDKDRHLLFFGKRMTHCQAFMMLNAVFS